MITRPDSKSEITQNSGTDSVHELLPGQHFEIGVLRVGADGVIQFANHILADLVKKTSSELNGTHLKIFDDTGHHELYAFLVSGSENGTDEINITEPDGRILQVTATRKYGHLDVIIGCSVDSSTFRQSLSLGKYRIEERIGSGGMGDVWKARDSFGNVVAVKTLLTAGVTSEMLVSRFRKEAEAMSKLQHSNICRIYEIGETDGILFIVMEYIDGVSLGEILSYPVEKASNTALRATLADPESESSASKVETVIRKVSGLSDAQIEMNPSRARHPRFLILPIQQTLSIILKICGAIQYAHEHGVFHRDIKPSNVVIRSDGEPLVLDFGVAKLSRSDCSQTASKQLCGTIEYMAPEQARASSDIDERADVYSIGAILYQMVSGRRHFVGSGNLLFDIQRLQNHDPARPRMHVPGVDQDLEAIMLKSLANEPSQRYANAGQLSEDIKRFRLGEPVLAKRPTLRYRLAKKAKKHRVPVLLSSLILLLSVSFFGYLILDYYQQWGDWVKVYHYDCTAGISDTTHFAFLDRFQNAPVEPFVSGPQGMLARKFQWCWLKNARIHGDVRVVLKITTGNEPDGLEICINSAPAPAALWSIVPKGYSCQFGGYQGLMDLISPNIEPRIADISSSVSSRYKSGGEFEIAFERKNERLSIFVNGRRSHSIEHLLPLRGNDLEHTGFRSMSSTMRIEAIDVYRLALAKKSSPIIAGDALVSAGHYRSALDEYRTIAADFKGTVVAEKALVKAYTLTFALNENLVEIRRELRQTLQENYPHGAYRSALYEIDAEHAWRAGHYQTALDLLPAVYSVDKRSPIAFRFIIDTLPPPEIKRTVMPWIKRITGIMSLDISGMQLGSLDDLRGMRLQRLKCVSTNVESLKPLKGQPISWLWCSENRIQDISALASMPLTWLNIEDCRVTDLSPLKSTKLEWLSIYRNKIGSLDPLRNLPIAQLYAGSNQISSVEALQGMPLTRLNISRNNVSSLGPLSGKELEVLVISRNPISDLNVLRNMPLKTLFMDSINVHDLEQIKGLALTELGCSYCSLTSLEPLRGMRLQNLFCGSNLIGNIEPLSGMPLRNLTIENNQLTSLAPLQKMLLRKIDIHGNEISSLEHLDGMELDYLNCSLNPVGSLRKFILNPPKVFIFECPSLPAHELRYADSVWSAYPAKTQLAVQARALLALQNGATASLRQLATAYNGSLYLYIPFRKSWHDASEFCQKLGGQLASIASNEEDSVVSATAAAGNQNFWIGLQIRDNNLCWVTGEDAHFSKLENDKEASAGVIYSNGSRWKIHTEAYMRPFVIEWKNWADSP